MESKRKKRQVHKGRKAPTQQEAIDRPKLDADQLIRHNAVLIEELKASPVWKEILNDLFEESIASVSGRFTNGRFYHGDLTRADGNRDWLAGYQRGIADVYNRIDDFITAKNNLNKKRKEEAEEASAVKRGDMIHPMEDDYEQDA